MKRKIETMISETFDSTVKLDDATRMESIDNSRNTRTIIAKIFNLNDTQNLSEPGWTWKDPNNEDGSNW